MTPVVVHSYQTSRFSGVLFLLFLVLVGCLFLAGFWSGGMLDDWFRLLGLLPPGPVDALAMIGPALVALLLVVLPVWGVGNFLLVGDNSSPRAFFFDNRSRRFLVSEKTAVPPGDLSTLSGYGYEEIQEFRVHSYQRKESHGTGSDRHTHLVWRYQPGFTKTDGQFWALEDTGNMKEAEDLVAKWEAEVGLKATGDRFPAKPRPLSPRIEEVRDGDNVELAWRGEVDFWGAFLFLGGGAGLALLLKELLNRGFDIVPVLVLGVFAVIIGLLGVAKLQSSTKNARLKHAVRVTRTDLEIGKRPNKGDFRVNDSWPLAQVEGIVTRFDIEKRTAGTRILVLKRANGEETVLDVADVSLSETIDLEQRLEQELRRRGAEAK